MRQLKPFKKGFVILFAVLLISIVLTISLSIFNITLKQLLLSMTVRESQYAFYASDALKDCLVYWQKYHYRDCRDNPALCGGSHQSAFGFMLREEVRDGNGVLIGYDYNFEGNDLFKINCGGQEIDLTGQQTPITNGLSSYLQIDRNNPSDSRKDCGRAQVKVWVDGDQERFRIVSAGSNQACTPTVPQKLVNRIIYRSDPQETF